ncbi:YcnI family protein [Nocardia sp. NPDC058176]|uniref:YcnI family copper-binding membrane protein n=1 Tax=Nocardia sp. NPDC058176 TaxID=3346368 RepID=UPI0036D85766
MVDNDSRRAPARRTLLRRCGVAFVAVAVATVSLAAPVAAHVRSDGAPLAKGGYGIVRLTVPGESDTADTIGLTVTIPTGVDLKSARTQPVPGWNATVERERTGSGERVSKIVWTADSAGGYSGAEYQEFSFSGGPWPTDRDSLALPADQRYSDGSVVSWNEVALDKDSKPEHPAPVVALTAATGDHGSGHDTEEPDHHGDTAAASASSGVGWQALTVVNLVLALAAVTAAVTVLRRTRGTDA